MRAFTFLEVIIATAVSLTSLLALTCVILSVHSLRKAKEESQVAGNAMRALVEQVHATSSASVESPNGWSQSVVAAFQAGGVPGNAFPVRGLASRAGAASVATVQVFTDETLTDQQLGTSIGMPRDLDGDGLVNNVDVIASGTLLPVVVTLQWTGPRGDRQMSQGFFVTGY